MNRHLLIVEDDHDLRDSLVALLTSEGYLATGAKDGVEALAQCEKTQPDLVLLDLGLPTINGETVCKELKKHYPEMVIIILTGKDASQDVVNGLSMGADDYLTKPFDYDELLARIKVRLRAVNGNEEQLVLADLTLDRKSLEVSRGTEKIALTRQEYLILEYLLSNKGRVLTREMILSRLWRGNPDVETRVVDVYIGYLRKKIDNGHDQKLIHSVRGFGYKIDQPT